ncbi:MAG TPA: KaiC domain-containing protein [Methanomassiliicoccales archaeon]|nr:KaiC domain-containing protein [Methanomassiliicoccales archaeon]HXZ23611.1 KaiC domain-containing protein [Methanomassiliicoccales archaeon]
MVDRVKSGVEGLDEMLEGGFPKSHTLVVMGSFGTGKTTFGLQFLNQGLKDGEKGIYISLEEDEKSILEDARAFGWDLKPFMDAKKLALVKLEPTDAKTTVSRIKSELPDFIKSFGASRVVVDSVSLLNLLYESDHEKRVGLFNLSQLVKKTGATCLMTAEVRDENPLATRDGLAEYVADGVIALRYVDVPERSEMVLSLRIVKMRRTKHSRRITPYAIGARGIEVHAGADI